MKWERLLLLLEYIYDDEEQREEETMARAEGWFSIGHHGENEEDYDSENPENDDFCWIWDGSLRVSDKSTHNMAFGVKTVDNARFKGWFDRGKNLISFYDQAMEVKHADEIPQRVYDHLVRRFGTTNFRVF